MSMRVLFLFLLFMPLGMMAQEAEESDFTSDLFGGSMQMPDVLPKGRLQWEPYAFYQRETYEGSKYYTWSPLAFLLRYGINSTTELRFQSTIMHTTDDEEGNNRGIADLAIGFKTNLFEGWKAVPTISLMGNVYIPGGERFRYLPSQFGGELDLLFANDLASWCRLGYMGGIIWDDSPRPTVLWGAYLDFALASRFTLSVEESNYYYGVDEDEHLQSWACVGLYYQLARRMEIGVSTDISLNHRNRFFDIMVGVAWQLTKK